MRVDFERNPKDFEIALLGSLGQSTKFIQRNVGMTPCQIAYRLAAAGIKRYDFRNGEGMFHSIRGMVERTPSFKRDVYDDYCKQHGEGRKKE